MKSMLSNKFIVIGGTIIVLMLLIAIFAPLLTPYEYGTVNLPNKHQPPSSEHVMGTDLYGRDVWCRIVYGARISLYVSFSAVAIAIILAVSLELLPAILRVCRYCFLPGNRYYDGLPPPFTIFNLGGMPGNIPSKYDDLYRGPPYSHVLPCFPGCNPEYR